MHGVDGFTRSNDSSHEKCENIVTILEGTLTRSINTWHYIYVNLSVYLVKERHTLCFHGTLAIIRNYKHHSYLDSFRFVTATPHSQYSKLSLLDRRVWDDRLHKFPDRSFPKPTPLKISLIFTKCVKYIKCAVFIIIARGWWTLWPTRLFAIGWRQTFRIRRSSWCLTLESALSLFGSLIWIVVPLKYDIW